MDTLRKHEMFEIEVLDKLKNAKFLEPLVFGEGTMLRLCYDLDRYSVDLDFWFVKKIKPNTYFNNLKSFLECKYDLTDAEMKYYTLLFVIRSKDYPKRLKIEIRRSVKKCDFQEKIAFSKYSRKQVLLRAHTLEEAMKNKIEAALERKIIRDFYDIEFLLKQDIPLVIPKSKLEKLAYIASTFKEKDYKVTLGSTLEPEVRKYYIENKFDYLSKKISLKLNEQ